MDRTRRRAAVVLLSVGATLGSVAPARAAVRQADVRDSQFPVVVRVDPGDTVRWVNFDEDTHTVTADGDSPEAFDSGSLRTDRSFEHTFRSAGTYTYHCERHPSMQGTVEVAAPATTTTTAPPTTTTTAPPTTTTTAPPTTTTTAPPATTTTTPPPAAQATTTTTNRTASGAPTPSTSSTTDPPRPEDPPGETTTSTAAPSPSTTLTTRSPEAAATSTTTGPAVVPTGPEVPPTPEPAAPQPVPPEPGLPEPGPSQESDPGTVTAEEALSARQGGGGFDAGAAALVGIMLAAGAFGVWSLWKLRPGSA